MHGSLGVIASWALPTAQFMTEPYACFPVLVIIINCDHERTFDTCCWCFHCCRCGAGVLSGVQVVQFPSYIVTQAT